MTSQLESCTDGNSVSDYPAPQAEERDCKQCPDKNGFRVFEDIYTYFINLLLSILSLREIHKTVNKTFSKTR